MTMDKETGEMLMTRKEVSDFLRVNTRTIMRWTKDGKISARTIPGTKKKLYLKSDMEKLLSPTPLKP
jgi:excisionase family DNA binding protein